MDELRLREIEAAWKDSQEELVQALVVAESGDGEECRGAILQADLTLGDFIENLVPELIEHVRRSLDYE